MIKYLERYLPSIILLGLPGLILKGLQHHPVLLVFAGLVFGFIANIIGTTTPEWRRVQLLRIPDPSSSRLSRPYLRMAAIFGVVALAVTIWFASLVGTLTQHPMLDAQLYFTPAAFWGSTLSLLILAALKARQREPRA